jgi:hypothetical protein
MSNIAIKGAATGSGTFTLEAPATSTNRTLTLPDEAGTVVSTGSTAIVTQTMLAAGVAGNGPAFSASSGALSVPNSTFTKIPFGTEAYDTNSNYDVGLYRFTPTVAGYYSIYARVFMGPSAGRGGISIYKNGGDVAQTLGIGSAVNGGVSYTGQAIVSCNGSTDYIEAFAYQESGSSISINTNATLTTFNGCMVRSAT